MIFLKDYLEADEYNYKVCEVSLCEAEAHDVYETQEDRIIDVCHEHYTQLENNRYTW